MSASDETIAYCHACGTAMDVSNVAPFSNVECPACQKHTRVKREFGPYTLLRRHAIGGMSMVFVGHDNTLDREVALKILSEEYSADEKRISSFEEEARITAAISHPHVVRVFKTGRAFERFYIAMELVAGGHLEHQIRERGALPEAEALHLAIEVAEGLRAAHTVGLIHRDIKPGNILLDSAGSAKIVDFGLALMTKGGVAKPDELWATPYYVPPETIEGLEEDYRADVYAFGATFYHVLSGKPPCTETSMVTTQLREAKKHITPLSVASPNLTMETCAVMDRAMAYDPAARFESYDELLDALHTALVVVNTRDQNIRKGILPDPSAAASLTPAQRRRQAQKSQQKKVIIALAAIAGLSVFALVVLKVLNSKPSTAVSTPLPTVSDQTPVSNDPSGLEIGALYQKARADQEQGNYDSAHQSFLQLRDHPVAQEPTRSWCGFEAMLSSFLNGNSEAARADAVTLADHLAQAAAPEPMRRRLTPWLGQIRDLPPVVRMLQTDKPETDQVYLMTCMASACKNWEQGKISEALPLFQAVLKATIKDENSLVGLYQSKARAYMEDADTLVQERPDPMPDTAEKCREKAKNLDQVIEHLQTKGRAKFNIRVWQVQLEQHALQLEKKPNVMDLPKTANLSDNLAEIMKLAENFRFPEAKVLTQKSTPTTASEESQHAALIALCEGAGTFLSDLENELGQGPLSLGLQSKDGSAYQNVTAASKGKVTLRGNESEVTLSWSQLRPMDVIAIYRETIKRGSSQENIHLRHENAICFQWLSGEKNAAQTAVSKLGEKSSSFKKRWAEWMAALK